MGVVAPAALASDGSEIVLASWSLSRLYGPRLFVAVSSLSVTGLTSRRSAATQRLHSQYRRLQTVTDC